MNNGSPVGPESPSCLTRWAAPGPTPTLFLKRVACRYGLSVNTAQETREAWIDVLPYLFCFRYLFNVHPTMHK